MNGWKNTSLLLALLATACGSETRSGNLTGPTALTDGAALTDRAALTASDDSRGVIRPLDVSSTNVRVFARSSGMDRRAVEFAFSNEWDQRDVRLERVTRYDANNAWTPVPITALVRAHAPNGSAIDLRIEDPIFESGGRFQGHFQRHDANGQYQDEVVAWDFPKTDHVPEVVPPPAPIVLETPVPPTPPPPPPPPCVDSELFQLYHDTLELQAQACTDMHGTFRVDGLCQLPVGTLASTMNGVFIYGEFVRVENSCQE
jgi:hypothetical protein